MLPWTKLRETLVLRTRNNPPRHGVRFQCYKTMPCAVTAHTRTRMHASMSNMQRRLWKGILHIGRRRLWNERGLELQRKGASALSVAFAFFLPGARGMHASVIKN